MEYPKFKVCCRCFTFNQAKYITDALNGFTMQQTSFPYVCTIVDDASTDGEQDVIHQYVEENFDFSEGSVAYHKETDYAHITYAQHKTNKNCYFAVLYLKENHYSQRKPKMGYLSEWRDGVEYEALCEGDDYWIYPLKLQIQVNYLECHQETQLVGSNGIIMYCNENAKVSLFNNHQNARDVLYSELCAKWTFPTASLMYRKSVLNNYPDWTKKMSYGDQVLIMIAAEKGNVATIGKPTCIYRKGVGITTQTDKQPLYMHEQHLFLYTNLLKDAKDKHKPDLQKRIALENKYISYYKLYNKSKVLAFLLFPKISLPDALYKLYLMVKTNSSRLFQ